MNTQEIFNLASELTEQQVLNIIAGWELRNEINKINDYNILIKLGDSMQLACSTVIFSNTEEQSNIYYLAYNI
jgi:hypothetical protein